MMSGALLAIVVGILWLVGFVTNFQIKYHRDSPSSKYQFEQNSTGDYILNVILKDQRRKEVRTGLTTNADSVFGFYSANKNGSYYNTYYIADTNGTRASTSIVNVTAGDKNLTVKQPQEKEQKGIGEAVLKAILGANHKGRENVVENQRFCKCST